MATRERVGLGIRLIEAMNVLTGGAIAARFREAAVAGDDDPRASEYRRLTGAKRDLQPLKYGKAVDLSFTLWQRNPLAKRMIEILLDFTTGEELQATVKVMARPKGEEEQPQEVKDKSREAQDIWEEFWTHPVNNLRADFRELIQDWLINGELILPISIARKEMGGGMVGTGMVTIGYLDPLAVTEVRTEPMNIRIPTELVLKSTGQNAPTLKVVRPSLAAGTPEYGRLTGEAIYARLVRVTNQTRGVGMLVDSLDWIDSLDQFLFDALEGFRYRNAWFLDVTMKGLTSEQIKKKVADGEITAPTAASVRAHNESVTYEVKAPPLQSQDVEAALRTFQTFVVGSKGFPNMWFGSGDNTNRATASEMSNPTFRMIKATQERVRGLVKFMAQLVMDQAILAGRLKLAEGETVQIEVSLYDLNQKDASVIGNGMTAVVQAMDTAVERGWVSHDTAKKILDGMVAMLGVKTDPKEDVEENQKKNREMADGAVYDGAPRPPGAPPAEPEEPGEEGEED